MFFAIGHMSCISGSRGSTEPRIHRRAGAEEWTEASLDAVSGRWTPRKRGCHQRVHLFAQGECMNIYIYMFLYNSI